MEINKKLDTDNDIDFIESGSLVHASNIVVNNFNNSIQNEHNIDKYHSLLTDGETIVGYIACSDEFVIFTSLNNIIRHNENTNESRYVSTNWNWQGGQVIGAYTYNVNNELIISITEINAKDEEVPLKIINLDKPNYVGGHSDKKYTLSPYIPKTNLINWSRIAGSSIDKGMYCLFIRYKQGDDYTPWISLGYPLLVCDVGNETVIEDVSYIYKARYNASTATLERFTYSERTDLSTEKVNLNIQLNIEIDNFSTNYEYFQLAYIVNTVKNEIKTFITNDYGIDEKTVIIDNSFSTDISIDDITRTAFNLYNVKTLCNYNNRLYLANYKEENPNSIVPEIDVSKIKVAVQDMVVAATYDANNSVPTNVSTRATTDNIDDLPFGTIIKNPTAFKVGSGYVVSIKFKLRNSAGNTKDVNARIFVNRVCYPNGYDVTKVAKSLIIDKNSLIYAVYFNSGYLDYRSDIFTYASQLNKKEYEYFIINRTDGKYVVKLGKAYGGSGDLKYKESWNQADIYILPDAKYAKDDFYYGFATPYKDYDPNSTKPIADIKYNILTDFVITLIEEFKVDTIALNNNTSLDPLWFYKSVFTFNGNKVDGVFDYNYDEYPYYGYNVYDISIGTIKQSGYYNKLVYCWMPVDVLQLFEEKHPNATITFRDYHETVNPAGDVYRGTNSDISSSVPLKLVIGYNVSTKQYVLGRENETYYGDAKGFGLLDSIYKVTDSSGNITYHTFEYLLTDNDISVEFPNIDKTTEDIADFYSDKTVYSWTEDIEPSEKDFNPNEKYSLIMGKYQYNDNDSKYKLEDFRAKAAGFVDINDAETNTSVFDKHFVIYYRVVDWLEDIGNTYANDHNRSIYIVVGNVSYPAIIGDLYIVFEATDIVNYKGKEVINGWICRPYKNTKPTDDIFAFVKYYDITIASTFENYREPYIRDVGFITPLVTNFGFYIDRFNEGGITDETVYKSDTYKTLIDKSVYNFFIHYVYPNGSYTDGIQIPNNVTVPNRIYLGRGVSSSVSEDIYMDVDEDTIIANVKIYYDKVAAKYDNILTDGAHGVVDVLGTLSDPKLFNVFPAYDENGIALYKNSNGDRLFRCSNQPNNQYQINSNFKVVFDNIPMNSKFIGYFISYEKTEPILIGRGPIIDKSADFNTPYDSTTDNVRFYFPEFNIAKSNGGGNVLLIEKYLMGGNGKRGSLFLDSYDIDYYSTTSSPIIDMHNAVGVKSTKILAPNSINDNNAGREAVVNLTLGKPIKVNTSASDTTGTRYFTCGILLNIRDNIYMNKNKKLISLGFIKYVTYQEDKNYTYGYEDYPYYYDYYTSIEHVFAFNKDGVNYDEINPIPTRSTDGSLLYPKYHNVQPGASVYTRAGNTPIARLALDTYSLYPLFTKTIKIAPVEKYYTLANDDNSFVQNVRTIYMYPTYLHDTFEISSVYIDYASKEIVNYNKELYANFVTNYKKTIRRSDVIGDESVYNTWKIFRAEQYRVISENKGNIINVVGIGVYLIAHCEHSMFIFNRDASMRTENKDVQLTIPDAFDIDYSEIFTSTKGYAGIQRFNQFVCTNYGYIFYDSDAHKIYRFNENNLDEITPGFKNLFKHNVADINFAIDESNERLICLGKIDNAGDAKHFTISYSFNIKNWISTHTYWYEDCFNTKNNVYFINNDVNGISSVDTFMEDFNDYTKIILDNANMFKTEVDVNGKPYSYIDVVFNNEGIDKVLNYITYITNKASDDNYSGDKLLIYTNCCYSDYINISKPKRSMKDYKSPYYRYGIWVFNWFRNKVANINTKNPIIRRDGKFYENTKIDIRRGLDNALIVGKYFVVRLIFRDDKERINVDDIQCY